MTLEDQLVGTWRRHNEILLFLLENLPEGGAEAIPSQSRGLTVAEQFAHLDRVRDGWIQYHLTGKRPQLEKTTKGKPAPIAEIQANLQHSGEAIAELLAKAFRGEAKIRMFGASPVRWMGYLISHESHHRGQIALALKQNGMRLPDAVALNGLWGKWIDGK